MVSLAENARIPVDNPATHLELDDDPRGDDPRVFRAPPGAHRVGVGVEAFQLLGASALPCSCRSGIAEGSADWLAILGATPVLIGKLAAGGFALALIETLSAKMRIFRAPEFLGTAFLLAVLGDAGQPAPRQLGSHAR